MSDCAKVPHCQVLSAQKLDVQEKCTLPAQYVGCSAFPCGGLVTGAQAPDGQEWVFPSTCIPKGWTKLTTSLGPIGACPSIDGGGN